MLGRKLGLGAATHPPPCQCCPHLTLPTQGYSLHCLQPCPMPLLMPRRMGREGCSADPPYLEGWGGSGEPRLSACRWYFRMMTRVR